MSGEQEKIKNSKRRFADENSVKKQMRIAKQFHLESTNKKIFVQPHRLAKHHVLDCGSPRCILCGNPRRLNIKNKLTTQERRLFQDLDSPNTRHNNGLY